MIGGQLYPFIDAEAKLSFRAAMVDQKIVDKNISEALEAGKCLYGFDASAFDTNLSAELLKAGSEIILNSFSLSKDELKILS